MGPTGWQVGDGCVTHKLVPASLVQSTNNNSFTRLFIIEGVATFAVALGSVYFLPDTPLTTRWLTESERILAHERIQRDIVKNNGNKVSVWEGLRQAASDPRTWLFALMQNLHLSANGFKNFFPTVVETLGFSETITLVSTLYTFFYQIT